MASQHAALEDRRANQERRRIWGRRTPISRRRGAAAPWRIDLAVDNNREVVTTRSFLDRRGRPARQDRRSYAERRAACEAVADEGRPRGWVNFLDAEAGGVALPLFPFERLLRSMK